ncbi:MAG: PEP-CTERM sorting domain-containing protein [Terrimicrobiaceae bacterium]
MPVKNLLWTSLACLSFFSLSTHAALITAVPGPDDQGGMIMPMVSITGADNNTNPTTGNITVSFNPMTPLLKPLQSWSPGSWFADTAAWRIDLGSPEGLGGTPLANAGNGDLFNNQYGFMFMAMPMMGAANIPTGKSLAIKLTSISSPSMKGFNYGNAANRWDEVWADGVDSQVLWNGSMWHNYFTLPSNAAEGAYTASFEIFIADAPFTGTTGFAQYDAAALSATKDTNFNPATVSYTFNAIPEPTSALLLSFAGAAFLLRRTRKRVNHH